MNRPCRAGRRLPARRGGWALALCVLAAVARAQTATELEARRVEPDVSYGQVPDFPLPRTILFSVGPDEILTDAAEWSRRGVGAFFLDFVARDWSSDIWATDGEPWTIGPSDRTFQKVRSATAAARALGQEVFLKIAFDHFFEWFNDTAWSRIEDNFRQFARFARDTGCTGLALDIEYVGAQYDYDWPGYDYRGYTRADLYRKVHRRMTRLARVLYDEFPEMVFLTFPEQGFNLGGVVHVAWIEEAARRHAPGGVHYCTEYTYRTPNLRHVLAHAARCTEYLDRLLSARARRYWRARCSLAAGVWPFGFDYQETHAPGLTVEELRQGYAASLMVSRRYNWIYSHNSREQLLGRKLEVYPPGFDIRPHLEVFARREIVTTPRYLALAREIRALRRRDYSADLGLAPVVSLTGPSDTPHLRLFPAALRQPREQEVAWRLALDYFRGAEVNFRAHFGTQTDWWLIGPFPGGEGLAGHHTRYPPEQVIDLGAEYDGVAGKVCWRAHRQSGPHASVDLTRVFQPAEKVCAYALCYVHSPVAQDAQLRFGSNDAAKIWLDGRLVYDYPHEGTVHLDRDLVPVQLPRGTTPLLIKVTNGLRNWGFVLRLTDAQGRPLKGVRLRLEPAGE